MGDLSDESEDGLSISPHDSGKKSVTYYTVTHVYVYYNIHFRFIGRNF